MQEHPQITERSADTFQKSMRTAQTDFYLFKSTVGTLGNLFKVNNKETITMTTDNVLISLLTLRRFYHLFQCLDIRDSVLQKLIRVIRFSEEYDLCFQDRSFDVELLLEVELLFELELLIVLELLLEVKLLFELKLLLEVELLLEVYYSILNCYQKSNYY